MHGAIFAELYGDHADLYVTDGLTLRSATWKQETYYELECWTSTGMRHLADALALLPAGVVSWWPDGYDDDDLDPEERGAFVLHFKEVQHYAHTSGTWPAAPIRKPTD